MSDAVRKPVALELDNGSKLTFYGKVEFVGYYDTAGVGVSDWFAYVLPANTYDGNEDSFSMSVRASKLGVRFDWPKVLGGGNIEAKIEGDFVGGFSSGSNAVYSPLFRLRQAYVESSWGDSKTGRMKLLLGQAFGSFDPMLFPDIDSWIAMATAGNPWIRLPQIRITGEYDPLSIQLSINRPMGADEAGGGSVDDIISWGEQSNMPLFMGRIGVRHDFGDVLVQAGVGGMFGIDKIHRDKDESKGLGEIDDTTYTWMANADFLLETKWFDIKGEFFYGQDLNTVFAGIIQGLSFDGDRVIPIRSIGGWGQISGKVTPELRINAGAGIDDPNDADLVNDTQRSRNITAFLGLAYTHSSGFGVSVEESWMRTSYLKDELTNDNWRTSVKAFFAW